jgi:hypothetical protein
VFATEEPVDWQKVFGAPMLELIATSYTTGEKLPSAIQSELDYQSGRYGYDNTDDMIREILIDMQR